MPPLLPSLAGGREHALRNYLSLETPRENEGSEPLEPELRLLVSLQLLAIGGVPLLAEP